MRQTEQSRLDAELIRALQRDGRVSVLDLARAQGVSRHVIAERLQVLTSRDGLRVVAAMDPGFAGHHVLTHSMVSVDGPVRPVAEAVARLTDAVFVSLTSGVRPLVVESRHATVTELHATLDSVRAIRGVRGIRVTTYAEVFRGYFVASRREDIVLDDLDREIIGILQTDGRISYRALAEVVHRSPSAVRSRVRRLIDAGVIRIAAIKSGVLSPSRFATGVGITVSGDPQPVRRFILDSPAVEFSARSHGAHDFVATVVGASSVEVLDIIEQLRELKEVAVLETWTHFDVIKEDYARLAGKDLGG